MTSMFTLELTDALTNNRNLDAIRRASDFVFGASAARLRATLVATRLRGSGVQARLDSSCPTHHPRVPRGP